MPELAECLGLPQVTFVSGYELSEGKLIVQRETDEGTDHIELPLPAVASVDKTVFEARRPNMRLKLKANHMEIPVLDAQALGLEAEENRRQGLQDDGWQLLFPGAQQVLRDRQRGEQRGDRGQSAFGAAQCQNDMR